MTLTLGEILGLVYARISNPDAASERMVIAEVNNAGEEILILLREAWNEKALETEHVDLVSGTGIYDYPIACGDIVKLERYVASGGRLVPINRVQLGADDITPIAGVVPTSFHSGSFGYVLLPNRQIRLIEQATASIEEGLRFTFYPRYLPMVKLNDEPRLPDAIHECLVPRALDRLCQHSGVDLANPSKFDAYRARMERVLQSYIYPADSERAPMIDDESGHYQEVF